MGELIKLMEGAVVLYKRDRSSRWQARLKLADKTWRRVSTNEKHPRKAVAAATKLYYEIELKRELKLPVSTKRFGAIEVAPQI